MPTLLESQLPYQRAFTRLNGTRQIGMGMNPITFAEMTAYLAIYPFPDSAFFVEVMMRIDALYMEQAANDR